MIYALALRRTRKNVAIGGHGLITGAVAILDTKTGQVVHAAVTPGEDKVISAVAYSPAGKQLALGTSDGSLWVWNVASPKRTISASLAGIPSPRRIAFGWSSFSASETSSASPTTAPPVDGRWRPTPRRGVSVSS